MSIHMFMYVLCMHMDAVIFLWARTTLFIALSPIPSTCLAFNNMIFKPMDEWIDRTQRALSSPLPWGSTVVILHKQTINCVSLKEKPLYQLLSYCLSASNPPFLYSALWCWGLDSTHLISASPVASFSTLPVEGARGRPARCSKAGFVFFLLPWASS